MPPTSEQESIERRLQAVEAAVSADDRDTTVQESSPNPDIQARLETLETRVDELDASVQAVRGFLGGVDAVNESVESRADAAIAAVERLERRLEDEESGVDSRSAEGELTGHAKPDGETVDPEEQPLSDRLRDQW